MHGDSSSIFGIIGCFQIHGVTDETMTYKQLITSVEAVACGLVQMGVAKGDVIVIYSLNSFEFIIMFLAISAVGGIAAPVNPAFKKGNSVVKL